MAALTKKTDGLLSRYTGSDTVFLLVVGTLLAWSISIGILGGTFLDFDPIVTFFRIFFVLAVLRIIFINRVTIMFAVGVIVITALILGVEALFFIPPIGADEGREMSMIGGIVNFLSLTIGYATGFESYDPAYDTAIQWFFAAGLAIFVFVFGFLWFKFFAILSTALIFGLILNSGAFSYTLSFYVFIFCITAYLIRYLNMQSTGKGAGRKNSPFALYALPLTAICLAIAFALPTPHEGAAAQFTENFITRPFTNLNNTLQSAFRPRHFTLAQTGFGMGNTRRLGGNVTVNYDVFMHINHRGPVYLTGNVFDRYSGYSWTNSFAGDYYILDFNEPAHNLEAFERLTSPFTMWSAENGFGRIYVLDEATEIPRVSIQIPAIAPPYVFIPYLQENTLIVEHSFRHFTVFTTGLVTGISLPPDGVDLLRNANGSVLSDTLLAGNARYTVYYADLPAYISRPGLLSESRPGLLQDLYSNMMYADVFAPYFYHNGIRIHYSNLLRDHLIPRARWINEVYTVLPDHFPARVGNLARYVVDSAGAVTTLEKAVVLEDFLRSHDNFTYSLTPGNTPPDRDFVDYFLFDIRMGYCTYFASAFVTMARTLGIPARYVEGFIVTGTRDALGYLPVINRQGHAWAEVYFEGFGWHRFDPTPPDGVFGWGDYGLAYADFLDVWRDLDDLNLRDVVIPLGLEYLMYLDMADGLYNMPMPQVGNETLNPNLPPVFAAAFLITAVLAMAILFTRALSVGIKFRDIAKKDNNEAVVAYFHKMLQYMRLLHYEISEHETAMAFAGRVGIRLGFEKDRTSMKDLAFIFSRARYSCDEISPRERKLFEVAIKDLDKRLYDYMGPRRYIIYKYIRCVV